VLDSLSIPSRHSISPRNTSVTLSPSSPSIRFSRSTRFVAPLALSHALGIRISPTRSLLPSLFHVCSSLLPLIALCISYASTSLFFSHTTHVYALSFSLSLSFSYSLSLPLSACLSRPSRSRLWVAKFGRIRGDVPSTPCAVCRSVSEGSVRRFHGGSFLYEALPRVSSLSFSRTTEHSFPVSPLGNKRINVTLRREYSRV